MGAMTIASVKKMSLTRADWLHTIISLTLCADLVLLHLCESSDVALLLCATFCDVLIVTAAASTRKNLFAG